jgi:hypothetical protein
MSPVIPPLGPLPATHTPLPLATTPALRTPLPAVPPGALRTPLPATRTPLPATHTPLPATHTPLPGTRSFPLPSPSLLSPAGRNVPPNITGAHQIARDLPRYAGEALAHVEATHVDRNVEARARAMRAGESGGAVELPPNVFDHSGSMLPPVREALPGLGAAMLVRVRFAGGEVPLWSLIAPFVVVVALVAALAASIVSSARTDGVLAAGSAELSPSLTASGRADQSVVSVPANAPAATPTSDLEPSSPSAAPAALEGSAPAAEFPEEPGKFTAAQLLALASSRSSAELMAARALQRSLERDPGLIQESKTLSEVRRFSENPETARTVLAAMAALPAPMSADLLYEVWTGTIERTESTELARTLLLSKDVRPKASPALAVALDLRLAQRCEDAKAILPRAIQDGDRRTLPLVIKLQRKYGCGTNKRADCYPCLRDGDQLENVIKAVKERREPRLLARR